MPNAENMRKFQFYLPKDLLRDARELPKTRYATLSEFVREAVRRLLASEASERAASRGGNP